MIYRVEAELPERPSWHQLSIVDAGLPLGALRLASPFRVVGSDPWHLRFDVDAGESGDPTNFDAAMKRGRELLGWIKDALRAARLDPLSIDMTARPTRRRRPAVGEAA
ncbi:MAG: hypothetical protein ACYC96_16880 [Fimbriimonadaceae bacterium]